MMDPERSLQDATPAKAHLLCKGISKSFDGGTTSIEALGDITLQVSQGEFVSIIGPSGCGKTTLLRILGGLTAPSSGFASIFGMSPNEALRARATSFMFQDPVLLPWLNILSNVELPTKISGHVGRSPEELLRLVGLEDRINAYPLELSGGMKQRVSLARALVYDPQLLLLDEPFSAVDEIARAALNDELLRIWSQVGSTIVLVTHSLQEAAYMSDTIIVLSDQPARIHSIFNVELPRPREPQHRRTNSYLDLVDKLSKAIA